MQREQFEQLVAEGYEQIPERYREKVRNVAFIVEDEPSEEVRREHSLGPDETLFGLYTGIPITARGSDYGVGYLLPDTIIIYQKPIEAEARDLTLEGQLQVAQDPHGAFATLVRQIVIDTVWHEVGHYLGLDEEEVQTREQERGIGHYHPHE